MAQEAWFSPIMKALYSLNNSTFFAGLMMMFMNIGSKYITIELSKTQEQYLRNSLARQFLIFAIAWFGTRDIIVSLILTAVFVVLADYLLNENSDFCVLPERWKALYTMVDTNNNGVVSEQEINQAIQVLEKAKQEYRKKGQEAMIQQLQSFQDISM